MNTYEKGIGVVAVIAIVAVLAIGGFATYTVVQNSEAEVYTSEEREEVNESEQAFAEVRADIVSTLLDVRADLVFGAQASVDAAVESLDNLSARVDAVVVEAEGEAQAELMALQAEVQELRAQVEAQSETATANIDAFIDEIEADIEASFDANIMTGDDSMSDDSEDGTSVDTEGEGSMDAGDDNASVDVEADATVESSY